MNEDPIDVAFPRERFESVDHGIPPRRASDDGGGEGIDADRLDIGIFLAFADDDLDRVDGWMIQAVNGVRQE